MEGRLGSPPVGRSLEGTFLVEQAVPARDLGRISYEAVSMVLMMSSAG